MFFSKTTASASALVLLAGQALGHGKITSPAPRSDTVGAAFGTACGTQMLSQVSSDPYGNIQGELQVAASDFSLESCNVWQCKGYQFADNSANVQSYTAGQVIPMEVAIHAPHTGYANVSIVDTASNTIIGDALASWDVYASTSTGVTANETSFSITMPDLGSSCTTAGECVIQWFWYAPPGVDQTYEDCIDFTMGGSGSASSAVATSAAATSAAATSAVATSAVAATSAAAASSVVASSAVASSAVASSAPAASSPATLIASSSAAAATSAVASSAPAPASSSAVVIASSSTAVASSAKPSSTKVPCNSAQRMKRSGTIGRRL